MLPNLPRVIIFDLDDTILDDNSSADICWQEVCGEACGRLNGPTAEDLLAAITAEKNWFWSDAERHREGRLDLRAASRGIVRKALASLGHGQLSLADEMGERYRDLREERLLPFPGAIETLNRVCSEGVRLGLITNGSSAGQRAKIERFDLARHFDHIVVEGEFGVGKPDRRVYESTLEALAARPDEAWMVGDNLEWDVGAPQQLGVHGIWVDLAGDGVPSESAVTPNRIIRSITELVS